MENVDVCPQIYSLGKMITLETVDIWTPGAGSGGACHNGDCGHMTPGAGSGRGVNLDTVDL